MLIGIIKWFDPAKGFGVITTPSEGEYFVHSSNIISNLDIIDKGAPVSFTSMVDRGKDAAKDCKLVDSKEEFFTALELLGKRQTVELEIVITGKSYHGNRYRRKENRSYNALHIVINAIFKSKEALEIKALVISYFEQHLQEILFIDYCDFLEKVIQQRFEGEVAESLLEDIYAHFGVTANELQRYQCWKENKAHYLGKVDIGSIELSQETIESRFEELTYSDLEKISTYDFAISLYVGIINKMIDTDSFSNYTEIEKGYQYLSLLDKVEGEKPRLALEKKIISKAEKFIRESASKLEVIGDENTLNQYRRLDDLIFVKFREADKVKLQETIDLIIVENTNDAYKLELWYENIIETLPLSLVAKRFEE